MVVVGEVASLSVAPEALRSLPAAANLLVCDPSADPDREFTSMRDVALEFPDLGIIVLTSNIGVPWLDRAVDSGARGYLPNDISPAALQILLQLLLLGENIFTGPRSMQLEKKVAVAAERRIGQDLRVPLSPKENEILECLGGGQPNKVIARNLNIAEATVKVHLKSLLRKINVGNRTQAAIWALNRKPEVAVTTVSSP
jgi:two-component system nitrate/nitrite response regulator NarL